MKYGTIVMMLLSIAHFAPAGAAEDAASALARLFADERAFTWKEDPIAATLDGVHDHDDRLPSVTPADQARRLAGDQAFLRRLRAIDRNALPEFDRASYDLFEIAA